MKAKALMLIATALALTATASAQTGVRIRGTITAIDATTMAVKSRDGQDLRLSLADDLGVSVAKAARFEDIRQGDYIGTSAIRRPDGVLEALEVHYLPPAAAPGHTPWDLQPGSTMTNANVEAIVHSAGKRELSLKYKDGEQRIVVPEGVPIVRAVPGTRADLAVGEYVFVAAQTAPDGRVTAVRVQVSKDGVKPPQ